MSQQENKIINSAVTANLWEMTGKENWSKRKDLLVEELKENGIEKGSKTVIGFQESSDESIEIIAGLLDFPLEKVHMFPSGLSVITDLDIKRESFKRFTLEKDNPLEFGQRGVGLLEVEGEKENLTIAVTHFTVAPELQEKNAIECINAIKDFCLESMERKDADKLSNAKLADFAPKTKIIVLGDFNADPTTDAYIRFSQEGVTDATLKIRQEGYGFSWPVDVEWLLDMHEQLFNKKPQYDIAGQQRWMDYIWVAGMYPDKAKLLGIKKKKGLYPSDHAIPIVFF